MPSMKLFSSLPSSLSTSSSLLSSARRVPGTRGAATQASATVKPVRPFYERLSRPTIKPTATVVPRNKLPATQTLAARTKPGASAPGKPSLLVLRAHARADYKQIPGFAFATSKIPRPTLVTLQTAPVRPALAMRVRLADVARHLKARRMLLSVASPQVAKPCGERVLVRSQEELDVPVHSAKEMASEQQCQASAGASAPKSPKESMKAAPVNLTPGTAFFKVKVGRAITPKVAKPRPSAAAKVDKKTMTATKPQSLRKASPLARHPKPVEKSRAGVDRKINPANRGLKKPVVSQPLAAKPALRAPRTTDSSTVVKKRVTFVEDLSSEVTVKQPLLRGSAPTVLHPSRSPLASPRAKHVFTGKSAGCVTLKRRFLDRFASVQAYEAQRLKDARAAGDEQPGLGQLDYGNSVFRIALQASVVITAGEIGMLQDLSTIGKAASMAGGRGRKATPVWVFGSFKEPFSPALIPTKRAPVYRKPKC